MFTGSDGEYRKAMAAAREYGAQIGDLLNRIEELGVGTVLTRGANQIAGPDFTIRKTGDRWVWIN